MDHEITQDSPQPDHELGKQPWTPPAFEEIDYSLTEGAIGAGADGAYYS
jgi:hypothetical protein